LLNAVIFGPYIAPRLVKMILKIDDIQMPVA